MVLQRLERSLGIFIAKSVLCESLLHNQSFFNQNNNKLNYDTSFQFRTGLQNFFEAERWNVGILRLTEILSVCHLLPIWQHPLNSNIDQSCFCQKKTISESLRDFPFHRDPVSLLLALDMVASYP